jgi:pSer/pThr/pTyr-binding forkhead associated (FHA) protein
VWILKQTEIEEGDEPLTFRMSDGNVRTIGRATRADFIVDATLVSRVHCRLTSTTDGRLQIEDLDSTNGTYVNGKKISRAELKDGDQIGIGRVTLQVHWVTRVH